MTDAWSRRDSIQTAGDVGSVHGAGGATSRAGRAPASQLKNGFGDQLTFSNFRKGQSVNFSTDLEIIILEVTDLYGLVKLLSRTLTEFLRVQTSEFEMPAME
jgi:hypothetical protein